MVSGLAPAPASPVVAQAAIIAAGVVAALHLGKLPPALPALRDALGLTLVQAGWLVSLFQIAAAALALGSGALSERFGHRRMVILGLLLLACGDVAGALSTAAAPLLVSRAIESAGMLLAAVSCPALLTQVTPPERLRVVMGFWGAYVPLGMAIGLLGAPPLIAAGGWQAAWWASALVSVAMALVLARLLEPRPAHGAVTSRMLGLIRRTLRTPRVWLLTLCFGCYSAQWIGVFSFLPTLYAEAGLALGTASLLTAIGVMINMVGNIGGGLLHGKGVPRGVLVGIGACAMAAGAWVAFGSDWPFVLRYLAILCFSGFGGMIPSTLFSSAAFYAPGREAVSSTVGLMQQGSSIGQVVSPVMLAALAQASGTWRFSWVATGSFALACLVGALVMFRLDRGRPG